MKTITKYAKQHRKNPTPAEKELKKLLLNWKIKFRSQRMYETYIVDFVIRNRWLILEVDGSSHIGKEDYDNKRDLYFRNKGFSIFHFPNSMVFNDPLFIRKTILSIPLKKSLCPYGFSSY